MTLAVWKYPVYALAYGLGTGLIPHAPGTFGSLIAVGLFRFLAPLGARLYAGLVTTLFIAGIFICGLTARDLGLVDPPFVVYDEIVGFLVAMFMLPVDWRWMTAGFLVFRVFDIGKPFPADYAEQLPGLGAAIMADDLVAGIYTLLMLRLVRFVLKRIVDK